MNILTKTTRLRSLRHIWLFVSVALAMAGFAPAAVAQTRGPSAQTGAPSDAGALLEQILIRQLTAIAEIKAASLAEFKGKPQAASQKRDTLIRQLEAAYNFTYHGYFQPALALIGMTLEKIAGDWTFADSTFAKALALDLLALYQLLEDLEPYPG